MPAPVTSYVVGLDLGQTQDFTAVCALKRTLRPDGKTDCVVSGLRRFPLGTPYTSADPLNPGIGQQLLALLSAPRLSGSVLAVDQTGVGRAVVDLLRSLSLPATLVPVTITAGQQTVKTDAGDWHVPKKDLVAVPLVLWHSGRLEVAQDLPLLHTLLAEIDTFTVKMTAAGNEVFGAWRENQHDDLCLSLALACWAAERFPPFTKGSITSGGGTPRLRSPPGELRGDVRHPPRGL
jgi:hypothetical protein